MFSPVCLNIMTILYFELQNLILTVLARGTRASLGIRCCNGNFQNVRRSSPLNDENMKKNVRFDRFSEVFWCRTHWIFLLVLSLIYKTCLKSNGLSQCLHQVGLTSLLQSHDGRALEPQVGLEVLGDLTHKALKGQLADKKLPGLWLARLSPSL